MELLRLRIELPGLPPSPNRMRESQHWAARANVDQLWRQAGKAYALDAINRAPAELRRTLPWVAVSLSATFYLPDRRRRDPGNLVASEGLKAAIDGLVDARLIVDDSCNEILVYGPFSFALRPRQPGVAIEIASLSP